MTVLRGTREELLDALRVVCQNAHDRAEAVEFARALVGPIMSTGNARDRMTK